DHALKRRRDVRHVAWRESASSVLRPPPSVLRPPLFDRPQYRGLQAAEREVELALDTGRQQAWWRGGARLHAIGVRHARQAKWIGALVALLRQLVDHRTARITEAQQLGYLVVRLARRIVAGARDQLVTPGLTHEVQRGVPARDDQHDSR